MMGKEKSERRKEKEPCGINSPDGALPLFIGGGDRLGGGGGAGEYLAHPEIKTTYNYVFALVLAPPHHYVVPSPYKQGESAIRVTFTTS